MKAITKQVIKTTARLAAALRQRKRAKKAALRTATKLALVTGAAAATVVTVRAVSRRARRGAAVE